MKYMSLTSATRTLGDWYRNQGYGDGIITLREIAIATDRMNYSELDNKRYIGNKLTHLKHYGLATPVYTVGKRKELYKVQLTEEGLKAVYGSGSGARGTPDSSEPLVKLESIANDIQKFQEQNPSFVIEFEVKIKKPELATHK